MRIGLVGTHAHPIALGLRYVSSYLKAAGHDVTVLFMISRRDTARADYSDDLLRRFANKLSNCDLIGMSVMTNTFHRACRLTDCLRAAGTKAPIVWGGTHATVAPEESLGRADVVCVGEGEEAMLQLAERLEANRDPLDIPSLWFRANGLFGNASPVRNAVGPLQTHVDHLPPPDYELDTHWVAHGDELVPARPENLRGALDNMRMLTARGCPYHCTFCNNTALRQIHKGQGPWVRTRSVDNVLAELRHAVECFPTIRKVNFVDDLFFVRGEEEIEEFAAKYNEQIGLPLELDAFPNTVSDRKARALSRVPIDLVSMGIESASHDTLENIYERPTPPKRIAEAIDTLHRHRMRCEYHYLVSNPYEPEKNVIETMRFIASHHRGPARLRVFPLMFYPGTPLYRRAVSDGTICDRDSAAYDFMGTGALELARHDYLAIWLRLVLNLRNLGLPRWLSHRVIDIGTNRFTRALLDHRWFGPTVFAAYVVGRKIGKNFIYQPLIKPLGYLRRRRPARRGRMTPWKLPLTDVQAMRRRVHQSQSLPADEVLMPPTPAAERDNVRPSN